MMNRFYTREFFALARARLARDGLLVFRMSASESYFSETRRAYLGCVVKALRESFPNVLATYGGSTFILASPSKDVFTADGAELARRYAARGVRSENFTPLLFEGATETLDADKLAFIRRQIEQGERDATVNADGLPRAALLHVALWDEITSGREGSAFALLVRATTPWTLAVAVALTVAWFALARFGLRRRRVESAMLYSVATTGLATMAVELVLLAAFQSLCGFVYTWIGVIVGAFMLGLVIGSRAMKRLLRWRPALGPRTLAGLDLLLAWFALVALIILLHATLSDAPPDAVAVVVLALIVLSGVLGGAIFPLAASVLVGGHPCVAPVAVQQQKEGGPMGPPLQDTAATGRAAASVTAADNIGACLGALVAGVLLVPALGIAGTCLVLMLLKLISAAALFLAARRT